VEFCQFLECKDPCTNAKTPIENFVATVLRLLLIHLLSTRNPILPRWNKHLNTYMHSGMDSPKIWVGQNVQFYASNSIFFEILTL